MGKLGFHTKALEALQGADLTGKVAIVTGGNSGIGVETVRALASAGAKVVLCCRDTGSGDKVAADLKSTGLKGEILVMQLDLADLTNVKAFATKFLSTGMPLHMLVLNAGVMACPLTRTKQGLEMQMGVNHVGHFLLTQLLLDHMKAQDVPCRIVAVSSIAHAVFPGKFDAEDLNWEQQKYTRWRSYGQSKLANVLFAKELAHRLQGTKIKAFSLHPGNIQTGLQQHVNKSFAWRLIFAILFPVMKLMRQIKTIPEGASTSVWAATAPELEPHSGAYLDNCQLAKASPQGQDDQLAKKLWLNTEALLQRLGY